MPHILYKPCLTKFIFHWGDVSVLLLIMKQYKPTVYIHLPE